MVTCVFIPPKVQVCVCVCVFLCTFVCVCVYAYMHMLVYVHMYVCMVMYVCVCVFVRVCVMGLVHTHTNTHIHPHTDTGAEAPWHVTVTYAPGDAHLFSTVEPDPWSQRPHLGSLSRARSSASLHTRKCVHTLSRFHCLARTVVPSHSLSLSLSLVHGQHAS